VADVTVPELVLTSSARRAVQTAELVVAALDPSVELIVEKALYGADADDVVEVIRNFGGDAASVLVVGHNPTVHELALVLLKSEDTDGRARLERGFPTAALAVSAVGTDSWAGLSMGTATLLELHTPER
jgi:phosphohistidine phosphatase